MSEHLSRQMLESKVNDTLKNLLEVIVMLVDHGAISLMSLKCVEASGQLAIMSMIC